MFIDPVEKEWGEGIPSNYTKDDIMTKEKLYDFALDVIDSYVKRNHFEVLDHNPDMNEYPSIVMQKDNIIYFVLIEADVMPKVPTLSPERLKKYVEHVSRYHVVALYASISFGSQDPKRLEAGLALDGDSYYCNFKGFEPVIDTTIKE